MERACAANFTHPLTRTDTLYFAVTFFSTVGFGDIAAKSEAARVVRRGPGGQVSVGPRIDVSHPCGVSRIGASPWTVERSVGQRCDATRAGFPRGADGR